jgi:hypothetical protein
MVWKKCNSLIIKHKLKRSTNMKKIILCAALIAIAMLLSINASAQSQKFVGAGLDIMLPVGSFADAWGTGFGGTAEFDYSLTPRTNVTGKIGYLTWSGKNLPSGVTARYSGVPVLAGIKFYPPSISHGMVRAYGHLELGIMFGSVTGSGHILTITESKTNFTIVPSLGCEIPAGPNGCVDVSIRYFDISRKSSIGLRAGYKLLLQ